VPLGKDEAKAIEAANTINAKMDQHRGGMPVLAKEQHGTLPWLLQIYKQSVDYKSLRDRTKEVRESDLRRILAWSASLGDPPMRSITVRDTEALWSGIIEEGKRPRTVHMHPERPMYDRAEKIIYRCSQLSNYALDLDEDVVERNVFRRLTKRMPKSPPRKQRWTSEQIEALCAKAIELGYASVALAVIIGVNTALRPGDLLRVTWPQYDPTIGKNGIITVTPSKTRDKTGVTVTIPVTDQLKVALDDTRRQLSEGKVVALGAADGPIVAREAVHVCQRSVAGKAWKVQTFDEWFRWIAREAGIPDDMQFRDLRRTAATQLSEAGCTPSEIAAIGGWTEANVLKMLRVYAPVTLTMAQNAIVKLEQYRAKQSQG